MANALTDSNRAKSLFAASNADGTTPTLVYVDSATNRLLVNSTITGSVTTSNAAVGATGSAVPANASYDGINVGGNLRGLTGVNPSGSIFAAQIDIASLAGTTTSVNSGSADAGTLRVAVAAALDTTNSVIASVIKPTAVSTYSRSFYDNLQAAATSNVKASAGNVFSLYCHNANAADRFAQIHNTTTTPSGGATPVLSFLVKAGTSIVVGDDFFGSHGRNFATGIAFAFSTTEITYTAGAAGDVVAHVAFA